MKFVYFALHEPSNSLKIGSSIRPFHRSRNLRLRGTRVPTRLLCVVAGGNVYEWYYLRQFEAHTLPNAGREWFHYAPIQDAIQKIANGRLNVIKRAVDQPWPRESQHLPKAKRRAK